MSLVPNEEVVVLTKQSEDDPFISVDDLIKRLLQAKEKFQGNRAWSGPAFVRITGGSGSKKDHPEPMVIVTRHNW